jgi:hypothetical protein
VQRPSPRGAPPAPLAAPPRLEAPTRGAGGAQRWRHGAARGGLTPESPALPIGTRPRITRLRGSVRAHNTGDSAVRPSRAAPRVALTCVTAGFKKINPGASTSGRGINRGERNAL